jgi:hypothetical protein
MKNFKRRVLPAILAVTLLLGTGAAMAAGGTMNDPLVTLSYLQDTVIPEILSKLSADTRSQNSDLKADLAAQIDIYESDMKQLRLTLRRLVSPFPNQYTEEELNPDATDAGRN